MLPAIHRMRDAESFRATTRSGRRAGSTTLVTHVLVDPVGGHVGVPATRVGFVVSKAVGGSVVRSKVKRRLRHLVADRLSTLPPTSSVVVRANTAAARASYAELGADLDRCLARILP
ncbi:ribonuclease P protein component [Nocardioides montaniterrae]